MPRSPSSSVSPAPSRPRSPRPGAFVSMGAPLGKSDRLSADAWLEVEWDREDRTRDRADRCGRPRRSSTTTTTSSWSTSPQASPRTRRSAGRGRPCSGLSPPRATASRTSGAAERAGIVHRLDVGTSGLMVVAKSERAYTELKRQFHDREVGKIYHAVVQGHPDPLVRHDRRTDRAASRQPAGSSRSPPRASRRSRTTRRSRRSRLRRCSRSSSRPDARTRSGCTWRRSGIPASATRCTAPTRRSRRAARTHPAVAARDAAGLRAPRDGGARRRSNRTIRPTFNTRLTCFAAIDRVPGGDLGGADYG